MGGWATRLSVLPRKSYNSKTGIARPKGNNIRGLRLAPTSAVIFDFIGTLTDVKGYDLEESKMKLCKAITAVGFDASAKCFLEAYNLAHEKYRLVRYEELIEVTNAVWIAEALNSLCIKVSPEDARIRTAVNIFFEDYVTSLELRPCAKNILKKLSKDYKLGLISNFTYAPVIHAGLRKLGVNRFFNAILVSEEAGWRKPSEEIFKAALRKLGINAEETVYVGDSPLEDVKGAKAVGMRTIFVPSQFYSFENLLESQQKPDLITTDICELEEKLPGFLGRAI